MRRTRLSSQQVFTIVALVAAVVTGIVIASSQAPGTGTVTPQVFSRLVSKEPVAVMFWSETCPHCRAELPHWRRIAERAPIEVIDIVYKPGVSDLIFAKYGVVETPTYMVFSKGRPVAVHVGGFGENEEAMLAWIRAAVENKGSDHAGASTTPVSTPVMYIALGALIGLSPCVLPMITFYTGLGVVGRRRLREVAACAAAAFAGILALGGGLAVAAALVMALIPSIALAFGVAAILLGAYNLRPHTSCPVPGKLARSGLAVACFGYGLLAGQCSLPLLGGSLVLAATTDPYQGLLNASLLAAGAASVLGIVLGLAAKVRGVVEAVANRPWVAEGLGGLLLVASGIYLLITGVGA